MADDDSENIKRKARAAEAAVAYKEAKDKVDYKSEASATPEPTHSPIPAEITGGRQPPYTTEQVTATAEKAMHDAATPTVVKRDWRAEKKEIRDTTRVHAGEVSAESHDEYAEMKRREAEATRMAGRESENAALVEEYKKSNAALAEKYNHTPQGRREAAEIGYIGAATNREGARADIEAKLGTVTTGLATTKANIESNKGVAAAEVVGGGVAGAGGSYFYQRGEAGKRKEYEKYGAVYKPYSDEEIKNATATKVQTGTDSQGNPIYKEISAADQKRAMTDANFASKRQYLTTKGAVQLRESIIEKEKEETRSKIKTQEYKEAAKWGAISLKHRRDVGSQAEMMRTTAEIERKQMELENKLYGGNDTMGGLSAPSESSMLRGTGMSGGMMSGSHGPIAIGGGFSGGGYGGVSPPSAAPSREEPSQPQPRPSAGVRGEVNPAMAYSGNNTLDSLQAPGGHRDAFSSLQPTGSRGPIAMPSRQASGVTHAPKENAWASLAGTNRSDTFASLTHGNARDREDPYAALANRPAGRENAFASLTGGKSNAMKVEPFAPTNQGDGWANLQRPSSGGLGGLTAPRQSVPSNGNGNGNGWANLQRPSGGGLGGLTAPPRQGDPFANLAAPSPRNFEGGSGIGSLQMGPSRFENSLGSGWKKLTLNR